MYRNYSMYVCTHCMNKCERGDCPSLREKEAILILKFHKFFERLISSDKVRLKIANCVINSLDLNFMHHFIGTFV